MSQQLNNNNNVLHVNTKMLMSHLEQISRSKDYISLVIAKSSSNELGDVTSSRT